MLNNKKIVIIGPAGTGKTTIKRVFFDMGNPLNYLSNPLEPTKGMNSSVYNIFDTSVAIFDLAGQEMDSWLSSDQYVLIDASIILCVFDINGYLQENFKLIQKIFNVITKKETIDCKLVIFLHKIDTIDSLYAHHKLKATKEFVFDKFGQNINADVYLTSIDKAHFLNTYHIVSKLFESLVGTRLFQDKIKFLNLENDLKILLEYDLEKPIEIDSLFYDLEIKRSKAMIHLKRLENQDFLEISEDLRSFHLTGRAKVFKIGVNNEEISFDKGDFNKILESLYIFSNLKKNP